MKKIIMTLFVMISYFAVNDTAHAFGSGIISSGKGYQITISSHSSARLIYDGDLSTYVRLGSNALVKVVFDEPINVNRISLAMSNPSIPEVKIKVTILDEGKKIIYEGEIDPTDDLSVKDMDVEYASAKEIWVQARGRGNYQLHELDVYGDFPIDYQPINGLSASVTHNTVSLSWENPRSLHFEGVEVYEKNRLIETIDNPKNTADINDLKPDTEYTFKLFAVYVDGGKSIERTIDVRTEKEPVVLKDVEELKIKSTHERVDLSWTLPKYEGFNHVNIYRDEINKTSAISDFIFGSKAYAASTKIFETNGTYFNDLTVKPQTTYEYTLTTTDGIEESEGVTVQATTPKAPIDEVGGVDSEEQENGDYLFKWTSPTKGDVQIYVGGKKYKKVPASDGKILIPKGNLKFNAFGDPDVRLQAIDEDGEEGAIISPGGSLDVPFTPSDIIKSGNGLFALIAPFVLLGLSFLLVPRIIKLIRNSNNSGSVKSGRTGRAERIRETKETRPSREIREYRRGRTT